MDFRQLRNIVIVAECRSFSKAAARLNISQPALSVSIKNLEREIDSEIFVRTRKDVVPTEFGAQFLVYARSALREIEKAQDLIGGAKGTRTRIVRLGINSILANPIAIAVLPRFARDYPNVRLEIEVSTGPAAEAHERISSGLWDFGVVLGHTTAPPPKDIAARVCSRLTTFPHARRSHPLAAKRRVAMADLADQRWVLSTLTGGEALISNFGRSGLKRPMIITRVNSFQVIMTLVEENDWVTFLPSEIVNRYYPNRFARLYNREFEFHTAVMLLMSQDLEMPMPARALMNQIGAFLETIT
jgi:DNA-binding transcriptional LysR family regulator